jgi:hypothetical protein
MKRNTFLNAYTVVLAFLVVAMNLAAIDVTGKKQYEHAIVDIWIWVGLLSFMGIAAICILIRESRQEQREQADFEEEIRNAFILEEKIRLKKMFEEMEDARNECELNSLENQSAEC